MKTLESVGKIAGTALLAMVGCVSHGEGGGASAGTPGGDSAVAWSTSAAGWPSTVGVAVDGADNVITAGFFSGSLDFGAGALECPPGQCGFVHKSDATGAPLWSTKVVGVEIHSVAVDGAGNVIIGGTGDLDFGVGEVSGNDNSLFLAKLDAAGNPLWGRRFAGGSAGLWENALMLRALVGVAADDAGNVVVTGGFHGTVDFGSGPMTASGDPDSGIVDMFVAKFDSGGKALWSKQFGDAGFQAGYGIVADDGGNLLVLSAKFRFAGPLPSSVEPMDDALLIKLDPEGNSLWSRIFQDAGRPSGGLAVDATGAVIVAGFASSLDPPTGPITLDTDFGDGFLVKLDGGGNPLWSKVFGEKRWMMAHSVTVDSADNVVIAGEFAGVVDFGGGPLTSADGSASAMFVATFDAAGNAVWSERYDSGARARCFGVATDAANNPVVVGIFSGMIDFGAGPMAAKSKFDETSFVAKIDPEPHGARHADN